MSAKNDRKVLFLVDGNNYIGRAFHATPKLTGPDGQPTNAVKGFMNILMADIAKIRPTHIGIMFDKGGKPNWRKDIYPEYKANRQDIFSKKDKKSREAVKRIQEMRAQMAPIKELVRAMGFRVINKAGEEADDLMGTIAVQYVAKGFSVIISSNDKDMCQLVGGDIRVMKPTRELLGQVEVFRDYGVRPTQIVDYLCMLGDTVDNVPGLRGVGKATASALLGEYGTIEKIVANKAKLKPAMQKTFATCKKQMLLNRKLITLKLDVPHKVKTSQLAYPPIESYDSKRVKRLCKEMGLKQTLTQIEGLVSKWTTPTKKSKPGGLW